MFIHDRLHRNAPTTAVTALNIVSPLQPPISTYYFATHVLHMDTTIRNIDPSVYKSLKAKAIADGITIGEAINRVVREWLNLEPKKHKNLPDVKPEHFGKQHVYLSEGIDEILYGEDNA